jgi:TM2 domain-containing membrane protein YozV
MTQFVDPVTGNYQLYKSKSKKTAALLAIFLGWTGAHFFYLGYKRNGWIALLASLAIIGGGGSFLFFFSAAGLVGLSDRLLGGLDRLSALSGSLSEK